MELRRHRPRWRLLPIIFVLFVVFIIGPVFADGGEQEGNAAPGSLADEGPGLYDPSGPDTLGDAGTIAPQITIEVLCSQVGGTDFANITFEGAGNTQSIPTVDACSFTNVSFSVSTS